MSDQAEEIRRRLDARQSGKPYTPPDPKPSDPPPQIWANPSPPPTTDAPAPLSAETQTLAKKRKMEAAVKNIANAQPVVVVDIKIKFWSMVVLMVKWAFASIPAMLIIAVISAFLFGLLTGLFRHGTP